MKTINENIIIKKQKVKSNSGIVTGHPKNVGVVVIGNDTIKEGKSIVYRNSFAFTHAGENYESVSLNDVIVILEEWKWYIMKMKQIEY